MIVINESASDWAPVSSGVPQRSVLRPVLFIIYIYDIDVGHNNFIATFTDDTEILSSVILNSERHILLEDFHKISAWSVR